jgi:hypothetical protein
MDDDTAWHRDDFASAFEAAFARLQVAIEEAWVAEADWPAQVAAAIRAAFEFAAANPSSANVLTNEALAEGVDGIARYRRLVAYAAELLVAGREEHSDGSELPEVLENALAGGLAFLVAQHLDQGRARELPVLAPEAIEFVLTPYLGAAEARRVAGIRPP